LTPRNLCGILLAMSLLIGPASRAGTPTPERPHPIDDFTYVGDNDVYKLYYDKNITYETPRKQATVYLLVEAKTPRKFELRTPNGESKTRQWRYMIQRTDVDCNKGIYISDFVTYLEEGSGKIIQEGSDGTPYKVNDESLVGQVYRLICAKM
jgi:hypothetical protein